MSGRVGDRVTKPTRGREEPHIGSTLHDDPKPATFQTGVVAGGTTHPLAEPVVDEPAEDAEEGDEE